MLDTATKPFDVSTLEDEVSALVTERSPSLATSSLRRFNAATDQRAFESRIQNDSEVAQPKAGPADVAEDAINPSHYRKHPSGIECIEITRHLNFNVGNAIKYLWRHMDKGDPVENLKKAQWYIDDEIRRLQGLR
jgi:hypothetical protein